MYMKDWYAARSCGGKGASDARVSVAVHPNSGIQRLMEYPAFVILDSISDIREPKFLLSDILV
jgi:hypothetical protein